MCGLDTIACVVRCRSKLTGFGPGLETFDVGDSMNLVHSFVVEFHSYKTPRKTAIKKRSHYLKPTPSTLLVFVFGGVTGWSADCFTFWAEPAACC